MKTLKAEKQKEDEKGSGAEEIYRRYAQTVFKFLRAQTGQADLAEELTQETFYRAVQSIQNFDGSCKLSVWLCQIGRHVWYQYLKKHEKEKEAGPYGFETAVPSVEQEVIAKENQLELLKQIHQLNDASKEVIYLRSFGGLSFREIGEIMGKSEVWARVVFYRGKEKLKKWQEEQA